MLWEITITPKKSFADTQAEEVKADIAAVGLNIQTNVVAARGFLVEGDVSPEQIQRIADNLIVDAVVEDGVISNLTDETSKTDPAVANWKSLYVLPKPGVMDPVAQSALKAINDDFKIPAKAVRTFKKFWFDNATDDQLKTLAEKVLANDSVEQTIFGALPFKTLDVGSPYQFKLVTVPIRTMSDEELTTLSKKGQLFLSLTEMQTIKAFFEKLDRDPTDVELETIAQTWSEHCSHKTLAGRIHYKDDQVEMTFKNMLKETIFQSTVEIRKRLGDNDWCVSVFKDNAGVVTFDDQYNICFKVETHNHPSALEPYGGANTGLGGVIRDPMGTGMGAKPVCSTDVFCFAPPETPLEDIPEGVLHPKRVIRGVVSGVRDYGNRMGIPTVNGAVYFDKRYLGNPLVYAGNVGLIPVNGSFKQPMPNDLIIAVGGRTGRDGIHGATFSSAELTHESETLSGGAVQIGNAVTEKMVLDVMLEARDRGLYNAVTDCGAGGFSSAVGEMGEEIGATVDLNAIPVKYEGLSYTEMWISEAQERMVFAVPEDKWPEMKALCESEDVEAVCLGRFEPTGRLTLKYNDTVVCDLPMEFMHDGRPPVIREATYTPAPESETLSGEPKFDLLESLKAILSSYNVASKQWVVRQYDHEVQGGSVIKPLVGVNDDGPGDAAVVRPRQETMQGVVMSCGMNPYYGDLDPKWMAASAIDEAIRNAVAVGADPDKIAILDNFCWGNTDRPETLGSLVRAALACHDMALELGTPFVSGKDSLNNEFRPAGQEPISIPPSLLISAMGQVKDVRKCVTMDLKTPGNVVMLAGWTNNELGGSHYNLVNGLTGGRVPKVDVNEAGLIFHAVHAAIDAGLVRACHDLSEGGLAVAAAEMAFAGGWGVDLDIDVLACEAAILENATAKLFSESNTRFLLEVAPENVEKVQAIFGDMPCDPIGVVTEDKTMTVSAGDIELFSESIDVLKDAWIKPLDF